MNKTITITQKRAMDLASQDVILHLSEWCYVYDIYSLDDLHLDFGEDFKVGPHNTPLDDIDERDTVVRIAQDQTRKGGADVYDDKFLLFRNPYELVYVQVVNES